MQTPLATGVYTRWLRHHRYDRSMNNGMIEDENVLIVFTKRFAWRY